MGKDKNKEDVKRGRIEQFLVERDMHLLSDAREGISVGSIYMEAPDEEKARPIGSVSNFVEPPVQLPKPKEGLQGFIQEEFRESKSVSFIAKAISKVISGLGFSINSNKEKILEVNYEKVSFEEVELVEIGDLLKDKKLKTSSMYYKPINEYYVVTKLLKSPNFKVYVKLTNDLKSKLDAAANNGVVEGQIKMEYAKGKSNEVTMTYIGERPLIFAVHLERIFRNTDAKIFDMKALSKVTQLLAPKERVWPR